MNPFAVSGLLTGVSSTILAFIVRVKSPNKKLGRIWVFFGLSVAMWGFGSLGIALSKDAGMSLWIWRVADIFGVVTIPALFYHFVVIFCEIKRRKLLILHYVVMSICLLLEPTGLFIPRVRWMFNSFYYSTAGPLYPWYAAWWFASILYSHYELIRSYRHSSVDKRNQIKYFLCATVVGFSGGSLCFLPDFNIDIYPWGNFTIPLYSCIMSYAILKHHLLNINLIIRKTLIYSVVTGTLTGIYLVIVMLCIRLLGGFSASPTISAAIAACVITIIVHPLLKGVQAFVDRHFFRDLLEREIVREIAGGFAHELKSPFAAISLPAELTLMDLEDIRQGKSAFNDLFPQIKNRLKHIIQRAMDASSKIEAIRGVSELSDLQMEPVCLPAILQNSLADLQSLLRQTDVRVKKAIENSMPVVRGNAKQLEIVFTNLMKNAVEAMVVSKENRPRVLLVSAFEQDDSVLVSIKDTGAGIPAKNLGRIFEPHFTTKGTSGRGMGLHLSHKAVKAHGGFIEVESEEGKGTEFTVCLPKYVADKTTAYQVA